MTISVQYQSSRREVWNAYWWAWRQLGGYWWVHLLVVVEVFGAVLLSQTDGKSVSVRSVAVAAVVALAVVAIIPLVPQIMFKPQLRTLQIDEGGLNTTIGLIDGRRSWSQIARIVDRNGLIYIVGKSRFIPFLPAGFLVVPPRAFGSDRDRRHFLELARKWHGASKAPRGSRHRA